MQLLRKQSRLIRKNLRAIGRNLKIFGSVCVIIFVVLYINFVESLAKSSSSFTEQTDFKLKNKSSFISKLKARYPSPLGNWNTKNVLKDQNEPDEESQNKGAFMKGTNMKLMVDGVTFPDLKSDDVIYYANETSDVILNAYMRSGSTFIGKLLGHRTDTFYLFEPLWYVAKFQFYKGKNLLCHYYRPYCTNMSNEFEREDAKPSSVSLHYLQSIFDCSFPNYSEFFIDTDFQEFQNENHDWSFHKGKRWNNYKLCRQNTSEQLKACLQTEEQSCKSAHHRVIKLLRMTLDNLDNLLENNQNLKIIQLFRDPRAIVNSHVHIGWFGYNHFDPSFIRDDAGTMCDRIMNDLKAGKQLQMKYPGRIKFIQYEDIGDIQEEKVKKIYKYVNMQYTTEQDKMVRKFKDSSRHPQTKGFHPYSYRTTLSWEIIKTVDRECLEVLGLLGYSAYQSEEHLRDLSQPAAITPLPYSV